MSKKNYFKIDKNCFKKHFFLLKTNFKFDF